MHRASFPRQVLDPEPQQTPGARNPGAAPDRRRRGGGPLGALLVLIDSERRSLAPFPAEREDRVEWQRLVPFAAMHLGCLAVLVAGWSPVAVWTAVALYVVRMLAITGIYHRYLSHRSFEAPRWLVFAGAFAAASAAQRGPLWWAAHHRKHHRHADAPGDAHSPLERGFLWSHVGWFTTRRNFRTDHAQVKDLAKFPELRLLDRFDLLAPLSLLAALGVAGHLLAVHAPGLGTSAVQMMAWGFCISTTAVFHATSSINSLAHLFGSRPFATRDQSRNSLLLALLTFGEGWHNNHHHAPGRARQGLHWWQIDVCWLVLRLLALVGIVRLRPVAVRRESA